jgi:predicted hydrocarbon binding protein
MRVWGQQAGLGATEFRLQPSPRKVHWMLTALCAHLLKNFGAPASLSADQQYWVLRVESCPACRGCSTETLACPILTGLLQEIMAWADGGRYHCVEEVACCALGASECQFRIEKRALD